MILTMAFAVVLTVSAAVVLTVFLFLLLLEFGEACRGFSVRSRIDARLCRLEERHCDDRCQEEFR